MSLSSSMTGPYSLLLLAHWHGESVETAANAMNPSFFQIQPVLRDSRVMNILKHDDSLAECQPLSVLWQGLAFQPQFTTWKETFS